MEIFYADLIIENKFQGGHRNSYNNCYSSAVLSSLHVIPKFWDILELLSSRSVVLADVILQAFKATDRLHDQSQAKEECI